MRRIALIVVAAVALLLPGSASTGLQWSQYFAGTGYNSQWRLSPFSNLRYEFWTVVHGCAPPGGKVQIGLFTPAGQLVASQMREGGTCSWVTPWPDPPLSLTPYRAGCRVIGFQAPIECYTLIDPTGGGGCAGCQ